MGNNPVPVQDPEAWKRKNMAFAIRSHRHLWGKNNEDPLAFLFRHGLSNAFSKKVYLGWNKFGQKRPYKGWGMDKEGTFLIPAGIVFPFIIDKELQSVFIISMDDPGSVFMLPGSSDSPVTLGNPDKKKLAADTFIKGLCLFQDNPDNCVSISPPAG
ncbi:MAG: hypothetical protein MI863_18765 [Desulfobacterales bacterium]|nr:hypothetical protein [Desulfobacterales bacterium]